MKKAIVYARISVTREESVSVERQIESAEQYAAAMGWQIVGQFVDDGVSATHNRPESRAGWRAVLDAAPQADVVVIWKIDRLARKVSDFMRAQWALEAHGAGLASVTEGLDLTTTIGQMVATNLAFFAQMEQEAISSRVKAARVHLVKAGRLVGGAPYGWRSIPNPDGEGKVIAQDPERIEWVRQAADRALAGHTLYSIQQWLTEAGAPLPSRSQTTRKRELWSYSTLRRLLLNPTLAGMTLWNPGNLSKTRGDDVLRDEDGLPVINPEVAILEVAEWRRMVKLIEERPTPQSRPVAMKAKTSGLLSGLVYCGDPRHGDEHPRMWRGTIQGRAGYQCPKCYQVISGGFEAAVIAEFLRVAGPQVRWTRIEEVHEGGAALLPEIEHRLDELAELIRTASSADRPGLMAQQANLLDERDQRRAESPVVSWRSEPAGPFSAAWAAAEAAGADAERRAVLSDALERVVVRRGKVGQHTSPTSLGRLSFEWAETLHTEPEGEMTA